MDYIDFSNSFLSLLPALIAILFAIFTRQVLLSLGIGIVTGATLLNDFSFSHSIQYIANKFTALFWINEKLNMSNIYMILFMLLLGVLISQMRMVGAIHAFTDWAIKRCKTRRQAKSLTALLVLIFFIDDFFHCISVGSICRPITDKFSISRAKLAYLLDSTAAPVCVLMPISSWGAYIIAIISGILTTHSIVNISAIQAFIAMIPINLYALFTLLMVLFVVVYQSDIGVMKKHEINALNGILWEENKPEPKTFDSSIQRQANGKLIDIIQPMIVLIITSILFMYLTGRQNLLLMNEPISVFSAFEKTDLGKSLVCSALLSVIVSFLLSLRFKITKKERLKSITSGAKAMTSAIIILVFAWGISNVMQEMNAGSYLANTISGTFSIAYLPASVFLLSCLMAFATGTSWGTFGIMLPIAGDMAMETNIEFLLPMLSAVLAGAVFGDHSSPISTTSILSSQAAGCEPIDHVMTQLPYAIIAASASLLGYLVIGFTHSVMLGILITLSLFFIYCVISIFKINLFFFLNILFK